MMVSLCKHHKTGNPFDAPAKKACGRDFLLDRLPAAYYNAY